MDDNRVIKSYVWHNEDCFFVSTIERDSSACVSPVPRYNETIVWRYDWDKKERWTDILFMSGDANGSIRKHIEVCQQLHEFGEIKEDDGG